MRLAATITLIFMAFAALFCFGSALQVDAGPRPASRRSHTRWRTSGPLGSLRPAPDDVRRHGGTSCCAPRSASRRPRRRAGSATCSRASPRPCRLFVCSPPGRTAGKRQKSPPAPPRLPAACAATSHVDADMRCLGADVAALDGARYKRGAEC